MLLDRCAHSAPRSDEARPRKEPGDGAGKAALRECSMTGRKAIELVWSMGEDRSGGGQARPRKVDLRVVGAGRGY